MIKSGRARSGEPGPSAGRSLMAAPTLLPARRAAPGHPHPGGGEDASGPFDDRHDIAGACSRPHHDRSARGVRTFSLGVNRTKTREGRSTGGARLRKPWTVLSYILPEHSADKGFVRMSSGLEIVIAGAVRTPLGKFGGSLSSLSAPELGAVGARAAIARAGLAPSDIEETIMGNARPAGVGPNPARQIAHRAGVPDTSPAYTVNMACGSSLRAIVSACQAITAGDRQVVLVGGAESMSRVPYLLEGARFGYKMGHQRVTDAMYRDGFLCPLCDQIMGETAETLAERYRITRAEQDAFSAESQQRCERARKSGRFADEIVPVAIAGAKDEIVVTADEHP